MKRCSPELYGVAQGLVSQCSAPPRGLPRTQVQLCLQPAHESSTSPGQNWDPRRDFSSPEICLIGPAHIIRVHHYYRLKISEDTLCKVHESANNKEIPMAGREAAKTKSVSPAGWVVRLQTLGPLGSPLWKLPGPGFQVLLTTQTIFVIGFSCYPEVSPIISHKSQSDIKADAKIHANLSDGYVIPMTAYMQDAY